MIVAMILNTKPIIVIVLGAMFLGVIVSNF